MGTWGSSAWDNDSAADWYADLFEKTKLAQYVAETLGKDPEEEPEEVRAAAYFLVVLGKTYVWPIEFLDDHLALAIKKLEVIAQLYEEENPDAIAEITAEIEALKAALSA